MEQLVQMCLNKQQFCRRFGWAEKLECQSLGYCPRCPVFNDSSANAAGAVVFRHGNAFQEKFFNPQTGRYETAHDVHLVFGWGKEESYSMVFDESTIHDKTGQKRRWSSIHVVPLF